MLIDEKLDNPIQEDFDFEFTVDDSEESTQTEETSEEVNEENSEENTENAVETEEETLENKEESQEETPFDWGEIELKGVNGVKKIKDFDKESLQSTLRKGEDYDRIRPGYELSKKLKEAAKLYDMEPDQVIESIMNDHFKSKAEAENTTVDFEKRNYELTKQEMAKNQESQIKSKQQENIDRFIEKFPDITPDQLPTEVLNAAKNGEDMVTAYTMFQNQKLASEMEQLKLQLSNAQKAPGASTTGHGGDEQQSMSAFAKGFLD